MYFFRVLPEAGVAGLAGQQASSGDRKLRHHIQPGEPGSSFAQAHAYAHLSRSFREGASIALGGNGYTSLRFQDKRQNGNALPNRGWVQSPLCVIFSRVFWTGDKAGHEWPRMVVAGGICHR